MVAGFCFVLTAIESCEGLMRPRSRLFLPRLTACIVYTRMLRPSVLCLYLGSLGCPVNLEGFSLYASSPSLKLFQFFARRLSTCCETLAGNALYASWDCMRLSISS